MTNPKGRILCTEDDEDTRELIIFTLNHAGFDVTCTDRAAKALELIRREKFDLCLLDNWLPGLSGSDLCTEIRKFDSQTPILFYSGAAFETDKQRAFDSGAQGYLIKPVLDDQLVAEVARLIAESKTAAPGASL
jgi:DNA-binding response OmpR family regulator